ncbi:MAG: type II secretion system F family protein [Eubacteriales bacterium]|nr:type II secretion system F family protein [Eubacteriales bacterium]
MMRFSLHNTFYKAAEKMTRMLPDNLTGNSDILRHKYRKKYGSKDCNQQIKLKKIRTMQAYMILIISFILITLFFIAGQTIERKEINRIERPTYVEKVKSVPVEVKITYKDYKFTKNLNLKIKQKDTTVKEKMELLKNYGESLEKSILGKNKNLKEITGPLNLVSRDPVTGITVVWKSDAPEAVNNKGEVNLLNAEGFHVELQAIMTLDDISTTKTFQLKISTDASGEEYKKSLEQKLQSAVNKIEADNAGPYLMLPNALDDRIQVSWFRGGKEAPVLLFIVFILGILIIYFKRYDQINKEIKEAEESIIRDLPEFMNKLVLLLNAGLVVSSAFKKIAEDHEAAHRGEGTSQWSGQKRILYDEMCDIQKKVNQTNISLIKELQDFSQRSGVRELVRMIAVISDNWNKGSVLSEKLEGESNLLWISRKKRAEEKGKLAETKLTFPLMILLIVLIMVTIAPALMEI